MAARYWVGGTDNWDGTAGNKWSLSSDGTPGELIPTAYDDVFFDDGSIGTITVTADVICKSLNCTKFTGTLAGTGRIRLGNFNAGAGDLTLVSGMTFTHTGTILLGGNVTGNLVTTAGKQIRRLEINSTGGSGGYILQDDLTVTGNLVHTQGSLDTNNKTLILGAYESASSGIRSLTLGSSNITINNVAGLASGPGWRYSDLNGTLNAGTSVITLSNPLGVYFNGGTLTYNTVIWNGAAYLVCQDSFTVGTFTVTPANTAGYSNSMTIDSNITVTGALTLTGHSISKRLLVSTDGVFTTRTFTNNGTLSMTNVDFQDITGAGSTAWTGTSIGNVLGNSGITFTASGNRYWVGNGGYWSDATNHWATTSGGAAAAANFPLPHANVFFDANSFTTSSESVIVDIDDNGAFGYVTATRLCTNMDWTGVTESPTFSLLDTTSQIFGSLTLVNGLSVSGGTGQVALLSRTSHTITGNSANLTGTVSLTIGHRVSIAPTITVDLTADIIIGGVLTINDNITFNTDGINVTCASLSSNGTFSVLNITNGTWTLTGTSDLILSGGSWVPSGSSFIISNTSTTTKNLFPSTFTVTKTIQTITVYGGDGTVNIGGSSSGILTLTNLNINGGGAGTVHFRGSNTIGTLTIVAPKRVTVLAGKTLTITTDFIADGDSANFIRFLSATGGSIFTITKASGTVNTDFMIIKDSTATGGATWNATNSFDAGNNTGWIFTSMPNRYKLMM